MRGQSVAVKHRPGERYFDTSAANEAHAEVVREELRDYRDRLLAGGDRRNESRLACSVLIVVDVAARPAPRRPLDGFAVGFRRSLIEEVRRRNQLRADSNLTWRGAHCISPLSLSSTDVIACRTSSCFVTASRDSYSSVK